VVALVGSSPQLTAATEGGPTLSYQWFFSPFDSSLVGATNIVGAIGRSLVATNTQLQQSGYYGAVMTDLLGENHTSITFLKVVSQPALSVMEATPNQACKLSVRSTLGGDYQVLASTNLIDWTPVQNIFGSLVFVTPAPQSFKEFSDRDAVNYGQRFYHSVVFK
jgi:hypothetical protein